MRRSRPGNEAALGSSRDSADESGRPPTGIRLEAVNGPVPGDRGAGGQGEGRTGERYTVTSNARNRE